MLEKLFKKASIKISNEREHWKKDIEISISHSVNEINEWIDAFLKISSCTIKDIVEV